MTHAVIPNRSVPAARHFERAAYAAYVNASRPQNHHAGITAGEFCRTLFPSDEVAPRLFTDYAQRAATNPADSATGWAAELADQVSLAFLRELGQESAASRLIARTVSFAVDGGVILLPRRATGPIAAPWIGEGDPIPNYGDAITGVKLDRAKKVAFLVSTTRELAKRPAAQEVFNVLLRESAARSLDSAVFSDADASAAGYAGLLFDATDISGDGWGVDPKEDLAVLARTVASGSGAVCFVTGPGRAAALAIQCPELKSDIFASGAVSDDILIGIDPRSYVFGIGAIPDISASTEAVAHMVDENPASLSAPGEPNTVAAPVRSMFQTDTISLRAIIDVTYVARRSGAVAVIQNMTW